MGGNCDWVIERVNIDQMSESINVFRDRLRGFKSPQVFFFNH